MAASAYDPHGESKHVLNKHRSQTQALFPLFLFNIKHVSLHDGGWKRSSVFSPADPLYLFLRSNEPDVEPFSLLKNVLLLDVNRCSKVSSTFDRKANEP